MISRHRNWVANAKCMQNDPNNELESWFRANNEGVIAVLGPQLGFGPFEHISVI